MILSLCMQGCYGRHFRKICKQLVVYQFYLSVVCLLLQLRYSCKFENDRVLLLVSSVFNPYVEYVLISL